MEEVAHSWLLQHRQNLGRWEPNKEKVFLEQSEQGPGGEAAVRTALSGGPQGFALIEGSCRSFQQCCGSKRRLIWGRGMTGQLGALSGGEDQAGSRGLGCEGCGPGALGSALQSCGPTGKTGRGEDDHTGWPTGCRRGAGRGVLGSTEGNLERPEVQGPVGEQGARG